MKTSWTVALDRGGRLARTTTVMALVATAALSIGATREPPVHDLEKALPVPEPEAPQLFSRVEEILELYVDGRTVPLEGNVTASTPIVGPHYFERMGIKMVKGRDFSESDTGSVARVVILNEAAARKLFPGQDPIGKQLKVGSHPPVTVVGVAGDAPALLPYGQVEPEIYFATQACLGASSLLV